MKQLSLTTLCTLAMLFGTATQAAEETQRAAPITEAQDRQIALRQLSDPARYADDLCWVAPEWRDD
jgi:hypothetical protein